MRSIVPYQEKCGIFKTKQEAPLAYLYAGINFLLHDVKPVDAVCVHSPQDIHKQANKALISLY
jgi:predicted dehydrogenase